MGQGIAHCPIRGPKYAIVNLFASDVVAKVL